MSRLKLRICCHWSKPSTLTIVSTLSHFADWCKNINHLNIPDTPNEWRIPRKYVWSEIIYECFISKAPYWILESVYCSFHFDLIKAWRFWFQIYDSNRSFVFRKLKGIALLCIRDNETYKSESLQLVRSFIKKCFMQYQIYTIFFSTSLYVHCSIMALHVWCVFMRVKCEGLNDLSIGFLMSPLTRLVKLNVDHIPYLPINVVIYLSRSGDVLSQYFSSRWPQCITSQPLLVNTVVGQY